MTKKYLFIIALMISNNALAGWYHGKINMIAIAYDGETISIGQNGFTGSDCTCYSAWPNRFCLDRTRESFAQEYSLLLSAKSRNKSVSIFINETSCKVISIYEN